MCIPEWVHVVCYSIHDLPHVHPQWWRATQPPMAWWIQQVMQVHQGVHTHAVGLPLQIKGKVNLQNV